MVLLDDVGFGASSTFGGPVSHADRGSARRGWVALQPVPHDGVVRADAAGAADGPQPPFGGDGLDRPSGDLGAGEQFGAAEHEGTVGDDVED